MPQVPATAPEGTAPPAPKRIGPSLKATKLLSILVSKRIDLSDSRQLKVVRVILDEIKKDYPRFSTLQFLDKVQAAAEEISAKEKKLSEKQRVVLGEIAALKTHFEELVEAREAALSKLRDYRVCSTELVYKVFLPLTDSNINRELAAEYSCGRPPHREVLSNYRVNDILCKPACKSRLTQGFIWSTVAPAISALWLEELAPKADLFFDIDEYKDAERSPGSQLLGIPVDELGKKIYDLVNTLVSKEIRKVWAKTTQLEGENNPIVEVPKLIEAVVESWEKEGKN